MPITDAHLPYAEEVVKKLKEHKISVELDELIAKYYRTTITLKPKPKKKRKSIKEIQELFKEK